MNIQLTFDGFDDYCDGIRKLAGTIPEEATTLAEAFPEKLEGMITAKPVDTTAKTEPETAKTEPEPEPETAKAEPEVTEDFRVEVRKTLAKINKKTGTNTASSMIKEITGMDKLTQVPLEQLPELMARAKEVLNAG